MKHNPDIVAASTQESSPFYGDVILERGNYRIIRGRETRCYAEQYIVQRLEGEKWRNLSYHLNWDSIKLRHANLEACDYAKRRRADATSPKP